MFSAGDVSVVIPSYNSHSTIERCLNSIQQQEEAPGEIILADSSSDHTLSLVRELFPTVKVHHFPHRVFPGPARNRGAEMARGAIIAFIDSDCVAQADWVKRIAQEHSAGHDIVGGAIEVGYPENVIAWAGHLSEFRDYLPFGEARTIWHIPTCNISYRRSLFQQFGGFPNSYYPQEDLLFNYLLTKNGHQIWFDPHLRVKHYCRSSLRGYLSHQHRFGRVTRVTLSRLSLEGSSIARQRQLAVIAAPALGALKMLRNSLTLIRTYPRLALTRPTLFALLGLGAVWWARGFIAGALTGLSGQRGVVDPEEDIFILLDQATHNAQA